MANEIALTPNGRSPSPEIDNVSQKTGIRCDNTFTVRAGAAIPSSWWANMPSVCTERCAERMR